LGKIVKNHNTRLFIVWSDFGDQEMEGEGMSTIRKFVSVKEIP